MITNDQKANALFKKFQGKADTSPYLEFYEEPLKSSFIVTPENFWIDTEYIPETAPLLEHNEVFSVTFENGFTLPVLRRYKDLWLDPVPGSAASFYHKDLADALPHDYKDGSFHYVLKDASGQELAYGLNSWVVDFQAGVLTFYDGVPEGAQAPFAISFYRYIGRKTFEGVVKTDGTVQMVDEYMPDKPQDVTTKNYVDVEVKKVQDIVDKLIPEKPPALATRKLLMYLYKAYEAGTGEEHDCTADTVPEIHVDDAFYDGDTGVLTAYVNNLPVGAKELSKDSDVGHFDGLHITDDEDPYAGENQRKNFHKQLRAYITPTAELSVGRNSARLEHSTTGVTPEKLFYVDDPVSTAIRNVQINMPQVLTRYVSGVPSLAPSDYIQVLFIVMNAIKSHYGAIGAKITSSHAQTIDCAIDEVKNSDDILSYAKQLEIRPNVYTEKFTFQIVGMSSNMSPGTASIQELNARVDTVSDETRRVMSGSGMYPTNFGAIYESRQTLNENEELQMLNGIYQWPAGNYSQNTPVAGPNYDMLPKDGIRWVTFYITDLEYADGFIMRFNGAQGFVANSETNVTSGMKIFAKVLNNSDGSQTTGWLNCNAPYPGVGKPSTDGDNAMVVTDSSATIKRISFGPTTRTGKLYIRVGLPYGSTKFSTITVEPN